MQKIFSGIMISFICIHLTWAATVPPPQPLTVAEFIDKMANVNHYDRSDLVKLFEKTPYLPEVIERINQPFEQKPWDFYKHFFITPDRINGGVEYWQKHAATLAKISKQYGVPPAIIVAIIGIETKYGQETGRFPTLSTLATLSFRYPKRAVFFQNELENYLLLTREYKLPPLELYGSYAGALGIPQFMPSNYRKYAVGYDDKANMNLLKDHDVAMASIAYYLQKSGWQPHQPIAVKAQINGSVHSWLVSNDAKPIFRLKTLEKFGVHSSASGSMPSKSALIAMHNTHDNEYWLTFQNFYAIMAYNPRTTYAMAIYQLSEAIRKNYEQSSKTSTSIPAGG